MKTSLSQPKTERLFLYISLILTFILITKPPSTADMWWHLRNGEEMVRSGHILLHDMFSYTRTGTPWVNTFWLADIILYLVYKIGGFFGMTIFIPLVGAATFAVMQRHMHKRPVLRAFLLLLAAIASTATWIPRPQVFSFLFVATLDWQLDRLRSGAPVKIWLLPVFFALWSNLHGGYVWGFLLLLAFLVGEALDAWLDKEKTLPFSLKKVALATLASIFAILVNPNGLAVWRLPFHTVNVSLDRITEWASPDFHLFILHPVLWVLFLFTAAAGLSQERVKFSDLFKVLGFAYMTFISQRNLAIFVIVAIPAIDKYLIPWLDSLPIEIKWLQKTSTAKPLPERTTRIINAVLIASLIFAALVYAETQNDMEKIESGFPAQAVAWIAREKPPGPIYNHYNWGGYLIWALRDYPVYVDGRADLYGDDLLSEWEDIYHGEENAYALLNQRGVNLVLVPPDGPIVRILEEHGWEKAYEDDEAVVYLRGEGTP